MGEVETIVISDEYSEDWSALRAYFKEEYTSVLLPKDAALSFWHGLDNFCEYCLMLSFTGMVISLLLYIPVTFAKYVLDNIVVLNI